MKYWSLPALLILALTGVAVAAVQQATPGLYDHLTVQREGGRIATSGTGLDALQPGDPLRDFWQELQLDQGGEWDVWLDQRTALPTLALVSGKRLLERDDLGQAGEMAHYEAYARGFLKKYGGAAGRDGRFDLDPDASGPRGAHVRVLNFRQRVDGVPVEGSRFQFHVSRGNLVALGATRWAPVEVSAVPELSANEARARLDAYVRPAESHGIEDRDEAELLLLPLDAGGKGIAHRLVWRFSFTDYLGIATWTGEVDAHSGEIVAFWRRHGL